MNEIEEWRQVPDFPGYEVSNMGRVRCRRSANGRGDFSETPRILKQSPFADSKYMRVGLYRDGKPCTKRVHVLVLEAFVGPRPAGFDACHRDDDQSNNALSNLKWGTRRENASDRTRNGKQVRGEAVGLSKITEEQALKVKALLTVKSGYGSMKAISEEVGVPYGAVASIKNGRTWSHV